VATIAFGMGIDKPDVAYVFHTDLPGSLEAYYQEIGRAGRDGGPAEAHMLFGPGDIRMRRMFIDDEETSAEHKRRAHARLGTLIGYCETLSCRRQVLLNYFGESAQACGNCDNCLDRSPRLDGVAEAKLILAAIVQTGGRFGPAHIVDVLRGGETQKVIERGHHLLPSFASGAGRRKEEWHSLIRQMVAAELLCLDVDGHGGLTAGPEAGRLLLDEIGFQFRPDAGHANSRRAGRQGQESAPADDALLAALKALRLSLAKQRQVPAFVIFSDRTLLELAAHRPADREAFAQIHGVGAAKLKDFAQVFLRAIAEHG